MKEKDQGKKRKLSMSRDYLEAFITAVILALIFQAFIIQTSKIPTGSMLDTIQKGDRIFFLRFIYWDGPSPLYHRELKRQEIVVFKFPEDPTKDFIKRLIGLPGDHIMVKDNKVYVNGNMLDEPYVIHSNPVNRITAQLSDINEFVVPEDHIFVLGDNRDNSYDSRFWGFVPFAYIKGRGLLTYWSYDYEKGRVNWDKFLRRLK